MLAELDHDEWVERIAFRQLEANGFKEATPQARLINDAITADRLDELFGVSRGSNR